MNTKEDLIKVLEGLGFPPEVIEEHLHKFWLLTVECKSRELEFWGKYFVNTGEHYRKWGDRYGFDKYGFKSQETKK